MGPSDLGRIGGVEGDRRVRVEFQKLAWGSRGDGVKSQCPGVLEKQEKGWWRGDES